MSPRCRRHVCQVDTFRSTSGSAEEDRERGCSLYRPHRSPRAMPYANARIPESGSVDRLPYQRFGDADGVSRPTKVVHFGMLSNLSTREPTRTKDGCGTIDVKN